MGEYFLNAVPFFYIFVFVVLYVSETETILIYIYIYRTHFWETKIIAKLILHLMEEARRKVRVRTDSKRMVHSEKN